MFLNLNNTLILCTYLNKVFLLFLFVLKEKSYYTDVSSTHENHEEERHRRTIFKSFFHGESINHFDLVLKGFYSSVKVGP